MQLYVGVCVCMCREKNINKYKKFIVIMKMCSYCVCVCVYTYIHYIHIYMAHGSESMGSQPLGCQNMPIFLYSFLDLIFYDKNLPPYHRVFESKILI